MEDGFHSCCSVSHLLRLKRNISTEVPETPPGQARGVPMFWNLCSTCVLLAVPGNAVRSMGKLRGLELNMLSVKSIRNPHVDRQRPTIIS